MNKNKENRRDFLKKAGLLFGAGAAVTSLSSLIVGCQDETIPLPPPPPPGSNYEIDITKYPGLFTEGTILKCDAVLSTDASKKLTVIVKSEANDEFSIVQSNCAHQGDQELPAQVNAAGNIVCPRHIVEFSLRKDDAGVISANPQGVRTGGLKVYGYTYKKVENKIVLDND